jgi:hypothetical protein
MNGGEYLTMDDGYNQDSAVTKENPMYFETDIVDNNDTHV